MDYIGKYEVRRVLGEGATSTVYLGFDSFAQREVAIKVIAAEALRDRDKGRLYRHLLVNEASLAGKLNHPHIVQIFDAVLSDEISYIVMEYVSGGTLEQFCSPEGLLPLDRVVEVIFKCTRALDYAHRLGITHRDIKPANILLVGDGSNGDIKISDFGAALLNDSDQTRTQVTGVGSPAYMSPEQVQDQALSHQTDIYSLGVVMYQLLTGRLPFHASSNYGMVYQITNAEPPSPSTLRADLPPELETIVARAMQKSLDARYADWDAFAHDLAQSFRNGKLASTQTQGVPDSEKFETLRGLPFFREFSDVEIWEVVRFSTWNDVSADTLLMKDGEAGDYFCFLVSGEARVAKRGRTLGLLTPGDCFGEMAVVGRSSRVRGADVAARSHSRVITIRAETLRHASDTCRMHFYQGFLEVLSRRLTMANARLAAL
ncbi:protein kinase domain-containing protein [Denitratisoma oestradiolicum]|uniref:non-specific serine/threonine protein kinase n=1 Tax=Denitratisoma oestradiolicum TaxID=311182 RepID=A0A6S6YR28_9PROT|nr:protein kinase [Denitratisoma oestradiolicum]TWO80411.1 serine/threonine protein kinase [Denitratisoma oestradiolicum]CAB1370222.1 Serine/threonine protein kinase [Denitratisoma oestradiolicum]